MPTGRQQDDNDHVAKCQSGCARVDESLLHGVAKTGGATNRACQLPGTAFRSEAPALADNGLCC